RDARFVSIVSRPRILEFEFVVLSPDSIVIAYLRGACTHWDGHIHLFYVSSYETRARCSLKLFTQLRLSSVGTSYTRWPYVPLFHSSANSGGAFSRGRLQELMSSIVECFVHRGGSESKFCEGKVESYR
ncbi:hypothetical protein ALC62_14201, partial [Cyphomyrmex costatus]